MTDAVSLSTERGFVVNDERLKHWSTVLEEWTLLVERYCRLVRGDAPYLHGEHSNLNLLAGAAWRSGWVALEEFSLGKSGRKDRRGRADLWLQSWMGSDYVEGKFGRYMDCDYEKAIDDALYYLRKAKADVRRILRDGDKAARKLGVTFVCMQSYGDKEETEDQQIAGFALRCRQETKRVGMIAWCFPREARSLGSDEGRTHFSGVLLLGSLWSRGSSR